VIGGLGPPRDKPPKLEGIRHAHCVHGLALGDRQPVETVSFSTEVGFQAIEVLAVRNPGTTAVFANSELFAMGAMRCAKLKGLRVPGICRLPAVTTSNWARFLSPP